MPSSTDEHDPIALARANWEAAGWGDVADGMVAVTSVMRAHQILLARVETALRPYDLSFSRFELLRLRAMGLYTTDGHANFIYLPACGRCWQHVFDGAGLQVRHYPDGGVRIRQEQPFSHG